MSATQLPMLSSVRSRIENRLERRQEAAARVGVRTLGMARGSGRDIVELWHMPP